MFGHSVTMPNRPFPSPPKDLWDVGRTQFPSNTYKALRCEQLEGFEKNPSLCQASEVKCPWTIKCRKLKHSNATFHIFSHPISKGQGLRDSQHLCFQSWLWACRNQTPPPSSRIRTVCTGRGTSLCITKSQRFYLPLAVCVTMAPFRRHGSGLGATVAHVFTFLGHFGFAKSLPFQDIQGIFMYFVVDVFLTLRRFQLVQSLCAVAVMPWLLVFIV
jgi:hypothetical protein